MYISPIPEWQQASKTKNIRQYLKMVDIRAFFISSHWYVITIKPIDVKKSWGQ